ncbi:hypothetical protein Amsp01_094840 [Amycolatopsis sp. NBRC 101858]|uniref:hypothetical protein n=1 Tax=Amycolatopsis sp. NBRC 101858 TaxID=3032200 RepID=UPI0024A49169|nr:hypothetical protein [Amycolatopsis sp. NBRC 101858]GLY43461.1 hypothetical protein Amsp01_094840 [Amycolatopsis sp. NBRC 101858]
MIRIKKAGRVTAAVLAAGAVTALAGAPAEAATNATWTADVSTVDYDDVNVTGAGGSLTLADAAWHRTAQVFAGSEGSLITAEHALGSPANRVSAQLSADTPQGTAVDVEVRGRTGADDWTEWTPAGTAFKTAVSAVQARISLHSDTDGVRPSVRGVAFSADRVPQVNALAATAALTYKIFGTREGLTGHTTANGHVITSRDHFVALPSGRGLSPKASGSYSVRVCKTDNSRCEYAPVWDVGPWNTKDDYWNPASVRYEYKDLPQGQPEAYAAYHNGYNGGKDDLGYKVGNPAGIDLADGVFYDGLGMSDNGNLNVTYLWTGTGPTGTVKTAGDPMNVRASASTSAAVKGLAANYAKVNIECYVLGDSVTGTFGTSTIWDRIGPNNYVSDTYLQTGSDEPVAPLC